jgi:CheY-like chemotaxis protein
MPMPKPILLVEDNPLDRDLALEALDRAGLAGMTMALEDGVEALDFLFCRDRYAQRTAGNPAVIVVDLKMPKVDGLDVLRAVRNHPGTAHIPVVMLTGSREEVDIAKSYALGVSAYVVKPMDFQELIRAVSEIGTFWAVLNVPPPSTLGHPIHAG